MIHYLVGAQQQYDTDIQMAVERQIITRVGIATKESVCVVSNVEKKDSGFVYTLIDVESKEMRTTDMIRPDSKRFGIGYYKDDFMEELMPREEYTQLCEAVNIKKSEPAKSIPTGNKEQFYTQNGYTGHRHDPKLSTTDIAAQIRAYCKKQYPGYKFSIRTQYFSGGSSIDMDLLSGQQEIRSEAGIAEKYFQTCGVFHGRVTENLLTQDGFKMLNDITIFAKSYNRSDTDGQTDYFDETFYFHLNVGSWSNEYAVVPTKSQNEVGKKNGQPLPVSGKATGIHVVNYSEKAVAVLGETKAIKDTLKSMGGRFNPRLQVEGETTAGWIFPKSREVELQSLCANNSQQTSETHLLERTDVLKQVERMVMQTADAESSTNVGMAQGRLF